MTEPQILECDIGNSYCKWRIVSGQSIMQRGRFRHSDGFTELASLASITRARVATVASDNILQMFKELMLAQGIELEVAKTSAEVAGVTCAYAEPSRLGIDRWLAIVAAYQQKQAPVMVVDAGSALTVDLVDAEGQHQGGYIVPGSGLMLTSLLSATEQVRFDQGDHSKGLQFGVSTTGAVYAGVLSALTGSVLMAVDEAEKRIQRDFAILLTGGDAKIVVDNLPERLARRVELAPELVLDGLKWLLP